MDLSESLLSSESKAGAAKMQSWQRTVFIVTFINYAMAHFSRKCYTNVKTDLVAAGVNKIILSQMDMAFMFTYAIGSFISGRLGDMFPQKCASLAFILHIVPPGRLLAAAAVNAHGVRITCVQMHDFTYAHTEFT